MELKQEKKKLNSEKTKQPSLSTETHELVVSVKKIATASSCQSHSASTSGPSREFQKHRRKKEQCRMKNVCFVLNVVENIERSDLKLVDLLGDGLQLELAHLELLGNLLVLSLPAVTLSFDGGDFAFVMLSLDVGET